MPCKLHHARHAPQTRATCHIQIWPRHRDHRAESNRILHPHHLRDVAQIQLQQVDHFSGVFKINPAFLGSIIISQISFSSFSVGALHLKNNQVGFFFLDILGDFFINAQANVAADLSISIKPHGNHVDFWSLGWILLIHLQGRWSVGGESQRCRQQHSNKKRGAFHGL